MAVYSDTEIKEAVRSGHIVIHPYIDDHIRGSSVDVTLGEWFYLTEKLGNRTRYNPFDEADVNRYFGEPLRAVTHEEWCEKYDHKPFSGIPLDHPIIVLKPGERILAHTHEFIGIKAPGTSEMKSRSSWGRNGVAACFDAGWGDPGYINRWTMEIYNLNQFESVPLPVGERIAQLIFHHTGEVDKHYGKDKSASGSKYQGGGELTDIVKNWSPEQMLPRAYKDQRRKPLPVELPESSLV